MKILIKNFTIIILLAFVCNCYGNKCEENLLGNNLKERDCFPTATTLNKKNEINLKEYEICNQYSNVELISILSDTRASFYYYCPWPITLKVGDVALLILIRRQKISLNQLAIKMDVVITCSVQEINASCFFSWLHANEKYRNKIINTLKQ